MTSNASTSSAEGIPVSRSASLALEGESTTPDTSGPPSQTPFAFFDPPTRSWKTSQGTFPLDSMESSVTWPRSGTTRNGRAYLRQPLVRLISGGDSSYLHTPTSTANQASPSMRSRDPGSWFPTQCAQEDGKSPEAYAAMKRRMKGGPRNTVTSLAVFVKMWPTPGASKAANETALTCSGDGRTKPNKLGWAVAEAERMWSTPRASANENRQTKPTPSQGLGKHGKSSAAEVGGQLNPTWVEWLMGFPLGWTDLEPSETP